MRKSIAVLLSALALTFGAPTVGLAQAPTSNLRGQIVDAGGRGATGMRVELVSDRLVVSTTISTTDGHFSFAGIPVGNYVVRTNVNGQPTGVRVSVTTGVSPTTALLVLPSLATAAPAVVIAALGPVLGSVVAATVTVIGNTVIVQAQSTNDNTILASPQTQAAVQAILVQLAAQLPPQQPPAGSPPGTPPPPPLFSFIPFVPVTPLSQ